MLCRVIRPHQENSVFPIPFLHGHSLSSLLHITVLVSSQDPFRLHVLISTVWILICMHGQLIDILTPGTGLETAAFLTN